MAWTTTVTDKTTFGNQKIIQYALTADSATLELNTGLGTVTHLQWSPRTVTTAAIKVFQNVLSAGTASNGYIAITGAASADQIFLIVFGR